MNITVFCIYELDNDYPIAISCTEPQNTNMRVCKFVVSEIDEICDITFNAEKEWFPKGTIFNIFEKLEDGTLKIIGSEQGYSHKHSKSIVKSLKIAYPDNVYLIKRKYDIQEFSEII